MSFSRKDNNIFIITKKYYLCGMKIKDNYINSEYLILNVNAIKLSNFIKSKYSENYDIDYSNMHSVKFRTDTSILPAYINPVSILCDNEDIFSSKNVLLLDGFLRLLSDDIPDIDILVKVYINISDTDILKLIFYLNHWKLFVGQSVVFHRHKNIEFFFDRGVTQLLKIKHNLDFTTIEKLSFLNIYFKHDLEAIDDIKDLLLQDNVIYQLRTISDLYELTKDTKIDKSFFVAFFREFRNYIKNNGDIPFKLIKEFFETTKFDRAYRFNRADVISREVLKLNDDFFVKFISKKINNIEVKTSLDLKKELTKKRTKIKSKYKLVNQLILKNNEVDKDITYYGFKETDDGYDITEMKFIREGNSSHKCRICIFMTNKNTEETRSFSILLYQKEYGRWGKEYALYLKK